MFSSNMLGLNLSRMKNIKQFFIKLWVDQGKQFYNNFMQKWLYDNILMFLTLNEHNTVVDERFIRILKNRIYKN